MNITFEIDTTGLMKSLDNYVKKVETKLNKDVKSIAELIRDDIKENIFRQRDINGKKLEDNRPFTIAKKGFNAPLIHTGRLHDSISVRQITDGYEVYIPDDRNTIARKNQRGYINEWGLKVPARPFFGIRKQIRTTLKKILNSK